MDLRKRLVAFFASAPAEVVAVYLFGSEAREEARPDSDIDIAVLFAKAVPPTLMGPELALAGQLEALLGRRVDLVNLNTASPDLSHRVFRDGVILLDRDKAARIRFEVARRNEYFDMEPFRQRYRAARTGPETRP
jgi:predicted nucleotidyltransferase